MYTRILYQCVGYIPILNAIPCNFPHFNLAFWFLIQHVIPPQEQTTHFYLYFICNASAINLCCMTCSGLRSIDL
jgi:hypothetical protein